MGAKFSPNGCFITIADTAAQLVSLASVPANLAAVNLWGGAAVLSADGSVNVAGAAELAQLSGFSTGPYHLTITGTASDLLAPANSVALALGFATQLSQAATVSATDAANLAALHNFSAAGLLSIADTPARLASMAASVAALSSNTTVVAQTSGNAADYTLNTAQMTALLALPDFSMSGFTGQVTVTDTATALVSFATTLVGVPSATLTHITSELGADATVSATTAVTLAGLPHPINDGHVLTVLDTPAALLAPSNAAAFTVANVAGVSAPATVTVAAGNQLVALHGFAANSSPITIADTPAQLATLSSATAAIAVQETVLPFASMNAADYTLDTTQFSALIALQDLSWSGFNGPLTVQDNASNLAGLEASMAVAQPGSALSLSHGIISTALSQNAVSIAAAELVQLAALPGFSLDGYSLTVQDTPTDLLLDITSNVAPLVNSVTLATNGSAWVVDADDAARLAAMPGFSAGSAGMQVQEPAADILAPANAAGVAAASSVVLQRGCHRLGQSGRGAVCPARLRQEWVPPDDQQLCHRARHARYQHRRAGNLDPVARQRHSFRLAVPDVEQLAGVQHERQFAHGCRYRRRPVDPDRPQPVADHQHVAAGIRLACQRGKRGAAEHAAEPAARQQPCHRRQCNRPAAHHRRRQHAGRLGDRAAGHVDHTDTERIVAERAAGRAAGAARPPLQRWHLYADRAGQSDSAAQPGQLPWADRQPDQFNHVVARPVDDQRPQRSGRIGHPAEFQHRRGDRNDRRQCRQPHGDRKFQSGRQHH